MTTCVRYILTRKLQVKPNMIFYHHDESPIPHADLHWNMSESPPFRLIGTATLQTRFTKVKWHEEF